MDAEGEVPWPLRVDGPQAKSSVTDSELHMRETQECKHDKIVERHKGGNGGGINEPRMES